MEFPKIGLGTMMLHENCDLNEVMRIAIEDAGYRHIDCAKVYGNQRQVGEALRHVFSRGNVKREEVWITSKLWDHMHDPNDVERALRNTLEELQLDYLDLYLMHHPVAMRHDSDDILHPKNADGMPAVVNIPVCDTWKAMEKLVENKLCRYIGVSNFTISMLEKMRYNKEIKIQPFTNQIEFHLYMQQEPMIKYLDERGIILSGFSPLGSIGSRQKVTPPEPVLLEDPVLNEVAKEVGQSAGSVAIRFLQQIAPKAAVIVKSKAAERLKENITVDRFSLNEEQITRLKGCERFFRYFRLQEEFGLDVLGDGW